MRNIGTSNLGAYGSKWDQNTKFFHKQVWAHEFRNHMQEIEEEDGRQVSWF